MIANNKNESITKPIRVSLFIVSSSVSTFIMAPIEPAIIPPKKTIKNNEN